MSGFKRSIHFLLLYKTEATEPWNMGGDILDGDFIWSQILCSGNQGLELWHRAGMGNECFQVATWEIQTVLDGGTNNKLNLILILSRCKKQ